MEYRSIKEWPEDERPRERLLRSGADSMSTAHLLAIILRTGGNGKSALDLAREILMHFRTLREIEDASSAEFSGIKGMGSAKTAQVKAAFELGRRLLRDEAGSTAQRPSFRNSREVYEYYRPKFYGLRKERFLCALLDTKNRVFREIAVSDGTLTSSPVHPREVFKYAIKESAASVLFIHNHPSGDPAPSADDIDITKRLVETGKIIGIPVLDHVVVSDGRYSSIMEGKLNNG
ncbi:MAG: JAB domain-containing protein [Nitrospiraceae bacterium]|nr:MAG: JAB domain-containing protein [Nitrospiraceae bacterium]